MALFVSFTSVMFLFPDSERSRRINKKSYKEKGKSSTLNSYAFDQSKIMRIGSDAVLCNRLTVLIFWGCTTWPVVSRARRRRHVATETCCKPGQEHLRSSALCSGSMTFWYGSETVSCHFLQRRQDANKNNCCALLTAGTFSFTPVFKDNKLLRSHKTEKLKEFLCLLFDGRS